ncbi:MAG: hypothetical protein R2855_03110 [Thermomicrobiales bacterium]
MTGVAGHAVGTGGVLHDVAMRGRTARNAYPRGIDEGVKSNVVSGVTDASTAAINPSNHTPDAAIMAAPVGVAVAHLADRPVEHARADAQPGLACAAATAVLTATTLPAESFSSTRSNAMRSR